MKRRTLMKITTALTVMAVFAVPTAGMAHELNLQTAHFTGNSLSAHADAVGPVEHILIDVFEGQFRFDGQKGKPVAGDMANAYAVFERWWDNGDGTCTIYQETWEAQSSFWTEDATGATAVFLDPYSGEMSVSYVMHGFRATYENNPYEPSYDWCGWDEEEPPEIYEHLGEATMAVDAAWESEVIRSGKGKKNKDEVVETTVTFTGVTFGGEPLEIIVSDDPDRPSPSAWSGAVRMEIPYLDYIDNH